MFKLTIDVVRSFAEFRLIDTIIHINFVKEKNMDVINELSNELALTFLVERKFTEKIQTSDVPFLIDKIKNALELIASVEANRQKPTTSVKKNLH